MTRVLPARQSLNRSNYGACPANHVQREQFRSEERRKMIC